MKLFIVGVLLTLISWIFAWGKFGFLSENSFFPLWLGYILTINGLSNYLFKKSLLLKMKKKFIFLFLVSIPFWWFFEPFNLIFTKNWQYIIPPPITLLQSVEYFIRASIYFSTVIPAVLSTAFLFFYIITKVKPLKTRRLKINRNILLILFLIGIIFFLLVVLLPRFSFFLIWYSLFLILEPINYFLKFPSLLQNIKNGQWSLPISIALGALFTGFWWEMWNFYSYPKWTYELYFVDFFKIFEMPILGYTGYLVFGLEIYSFTNFCFGILKKYYSLNFKFS